MTIFGLLSFITSPFAPRFLPPLPLTIPVLITGQLSRLYLVRQYKPSLSFDFLIFGNFSLLLQMALSVN